MQIRRCQPAEVIELQEWIAANHYRGCTPPGCICALEFFDGRRRVGAMMLGRPSSRELDAERIMELTRMYFINETAHCVESQGLSMMRKFVRTWYPKIRLLLAYSDPTQGHEGTIYEADNWAPFGRTSHRSGEGWQSREGRESTQSWQKARWVRTP